MAAFAGLAGRISTGKARKCAANRRGAGAPRLSRPCRDEKHISVAVAGALNCNGWRQQGFCPAAVGTRRSFQAGISRPRRFRPDHSFNQPGFMTTTLEAVPFEAIAETRSDPLARELYRAWRHRVALTNRERDCVAWAAEGKTEWESAAILGIAPKTVESHLIAARRKLNAANKVHLIAKALRLGIID
ncbi:response regulator transcription factor [Stappia indica]|uniref:response regulator transcription factor n=2 Tax=Stappia indica TaxID=538381 RepID=UPI0009F6D2AF|nr:helix-turn-helix domain-containing protein [Stappia indica]